MALSYVLTSGNGATTNFAVPFSYLDRTHIHVYVDEGETTSFTWVNGATIQITPAPPSGTLNVEIRRETPRDEILVDYNNGSVLFDTDLDTAYLQCLFIAQEYFEQSREDFPSGHSLDSHTDSTAGESVAKGSLRVYDAASKTRAVTATDGGLFQGDDLEDTGTKFLAKGTTGHALEVDDTVPGKLAWKAPFRVITTVGDLLYGTASAVAARLGIGTSGQFLRVSGGLPSWQTVTAFADYASITSTSTLAMVHGSKFVDLSGASFTLTLPTAVGRAGWRISIRHSGTSLTQLYTLQTVLSQDIVAVDASTTSFILYTYGEVVTLESDGGHWRVVNHYAATGWTDAGVMSITATTTPPTKASSPNTDKVRWRRNGCMCEVIFMYHKDGAATGAANGSGDYIWRFPTGLSIDTSVHPASTTVGGNLNFQYAGAALPGDANTRTDGVAHAPGKPATYDSTGIRMIISPGSVVGSAVAPLGSSNLGYYISTTFKHANWRV